MLKKIATQQVQLGMYIHALDGSWLAHPFWKTKFLLQAQEDLELLLTSGVAMVWIDCSKGDDLAALPSVAGEKLPFELPVQEQSVAPAPATPAAPARVSLGSEIERASQVVNRSRQAVLSLFGEARMGRAIDTEQCLPIVEDVADSVARNPSALISLARLKTKDNYTYMHSVAVCALMVALARRLGQDEAQAREAGLAGLLHDIGKMAMPQDVLNKPGQLSEAEFHVIRTHPERGFDMLKQGGAAPEAALEVCLHHHEKMDGSGYPHRLQGEQISLLARMGAVCDVYDAITSTRPYKAAWDPAGSIQRMAGWKGHFDPVVFKAFVSSVGIYPVGSLVRLESGRLAVVADLNAQNLAAPVVRVFYSTRSKMPVPVQTLDLSASGSKDRVLGRESPQEWGFPHLEDIWRQA